MRSIKDYAEFEKSMKALCQLPNKGMAFATLNIADSLAKAYAERNEVPVDWGIRGRMIHKLLALKDRQRIWEIFVQLENKQELPRLTEDGYYGIQSSTGIFIPFYQFPTDAELEELVEEVL